MTQKTRAKRFVFLRFNWFSVKNPVACLLIYQSEI